MPRERKKKDKIKVEVPVDEIEEIGEEIKKEAEEVLVDSPKIIDPLTVDCNREDLNSIVAKVNEIIHAVNEDR